MTFESELKNFEKKLERLSEQLQLMQKFGLNEDLLLAFLCHNLDISEKKAKKIMKCYEDFYGQFIKAGMVKDMQTNNVTTNK